MAHSSNRRFEKEHFWRTHVKSAERYPGTAVEYSRRHGISSKSLWYWRKKIRREGTHLLPARKLPTPAFIPVEVLAPESGQASAEGRLPDPKWMAEFMVHLSNFAGQGAADESVD